MQKEKTLSIIKTVGYILLQLSLIAIAIGIGFYWHKLSFSYQGDFSLLKEARQLFTENAYLPLPDDKKLEYGMISGMLQTLNDPYTYFVDPPSTELHANQLAGKFGGVPIRYEKDAEGYWIIFPYQASSAEFAGIMDADRLIAIDQISINQQTTETELQAALRGEIGSKIQLTLYRTQYKQTLDTFLIREEYALPTVTWNLIPGQDQLGMIHINTIATSTAAEIREGVDDLQNQGAIGFILDFRNNGGGLVESGLEIARLFSNPGQLMQRQFKGQEVETFHADNIGVLAHLPIVILINENTASAAEIIVAAIKANNDVPVIGTASYGKTTIQYVFTLKDGSSIHVTSGKWWVPGCDIPIQPDHLIHEDESLLKVQTEAVYLLLKAITSN